jgi:hypothetical protein
VATALAAPSLNQRTRLIPPPFSESFGRFCLNHELPVLRETP